MSRWRILVITVRGKSMLHSYPPVYMSAAGTAERGCVCRADRREAHAL